MFTFNNYLYYLEGMIPKNFFKAINSWSDFKKFCHVSTNKEKGDAFELLTKLYFKINPIYSFYDEVWLLSEVPQREIEYLGLPSHDVGIDIIAKSGNEYHAIQCKYHSEKTNSVTFKEISTFISLVESNPKFTKGYICSSADLTSKTFDKIKTDKIIKVMSDSWGQLDESFFDEVRELLKGKPIKLIPFKPRQHQKKALKNCVNYFKQETNRRGKLIFPCGSGKSLTGYWMADALKSKSTIIAVPSLSLVKQTLEVYLRENVANGRNSKWLCICSDEGIGKKDDVAIYTEDLGVPCVTDPNYIEKWLIDNHNDDKIIFTTYQSGRIIAEISKNLDITFDVGIFDEAHKTVGSDKKLFSHLLFEENISFEKRIFMTATERFYAGSKDDILSMDDYDIYGDIFSQMSFKEAIELELLTDYKVITIDVKKSEISDFIKENNLVQLNDKWRKETEARSLASMLALRKAMRQFPIKNAVSFHSTIEKAKRNKEIQEHITETYNYQPIDTYTVSGKDNTTKRNSIVQEFASSDHALITNARCLTEGVDVPNIDCIVFADPRKSKVDIVQALGRALRKKKGKDWGYVILPVIYDEETEEIDNDNFNEILAIVRGLASNDERIIEYLKDKNQEEPKGSNERGELFGFQVFSDYLNEEELRKELSIRLWDKLAKLNWMPFEEARYFVRRLELNKRDEWRKFKNSPDRPFDIPRAPEIVYKDKGWISMGDWLGTGRIADKDKVFREFVEAREYVRKLKLKNNKQWREFSKSKSKPIDIPTAPNVIYFKNGWKGFGDWLGTGNTLSGNFLPFNKARAYARNLGLKNIKEWYGFSKSIEKPDDIPATPSSVYKGKGWSGMGDWLGTDRKADKDKVFREFVEAREYVRKLGMKNSKEWREFKNSSNRPFDIPKTPQIVYKDKGWINMGDWLGTFFIKSDNREYKTFEEVSVYAKKLNFKNQSEWFKYAKSGLLPDDIPRSPNTVFKNNGWNGWGDFLGTGYISPSKRSFRDYESAKKCIEKLRFKNRDEFKKAFKKNLIPKDIPSNPNRSYIDSGWNGWGEFLGKE